MKNCKIGLDHEEEDIHCSDAFNLMRKSQEVGDMVMLALPVPSSRLRIILRSIRHHLSSFARVTVLSLLLLSFHLSIVASSP